MNNTIHCITPNEAHDLAIAALVEQRLRAKVPQRIYRAIEWAARRGDFRLELICTWLSDDQISVLEDQGYRVDQYLRTGGRRGNQVISWHIDFEPPKPPAESANRGSAVMRE